MIGADVCHLNLHKTFAIPTGRRPAWAHWGRGAPGALLAGHDVVAVGEDTSIDAVSAAPFGSALIAQIPTRTSRCSAKAGLTESTKVAILNANYLKARLEGAYDVLYKRRTARWRTR